jgi:hypothetical protein
MTAVPVEITSDFLDVANVVTGGSSLPLTGWQRTAAIQAMHALGYRVERIQQALQIERRWYLAKLARDEAGVDLYAGDDQLDPLAVEWVCCGAPMPLRGADRDEAVRRLAPRHTAGEIARLLCTNPAQVSALASRLGVSTNAGKNHRTLVAA